jgi:hypothetical protein
MQVCASPMGFLDHNGEMNWPIHFLCFWLEPCVLINFYKWIIGNSYNPVGWQRNCMVFCCNIKMCVSLWYWKVLWHFKINELTLFSAYTTRIFMTFFVLVLFWGFCIHVFCLSSLLSFRKLLSKAGFKSIFRLFTKARLVLFNLALETIQLYLSLNTNCCFSQLHE